ncbi:hypothetical protein [Streptomyces sp. NPDC001601]|uniref:hypothetical protein n=1 Tax=Streptomyces sp. NPDC001601 TaxID=3364592 RepID=UPI00368B010B
MVSRTCPDLVKRGEAPDRAGRVDFFGQVRRRKGSIFVDLGKGMKRVEEILTSGELLIAIMSLVTAGLPPASWETPGNLPEAAQGKRQEHHHAEGTAHAARDH